MSDEKAELRTTPGSVATDREVVGLAWAEPFPGTCAPPCRGKWPETYCLDISDCILTEGHDGGHAFTAIEKVFNPAGRLVRNRPVIITIEEIRA
jgi:hypothetical protein